MKEEKPEGDFQIQEERRLFYVALTRARQQLTLSTLVNKRKKPSPFLENFLANPKIKKFDTKQLAPKVQVPALVEITGPEPDSVEPTQLFPPGSEPTRAYSRVALWAKAFHPPRPEPLQLSASAIDAYDRCPMRYMFQYVWSVRGGPHAHGHVRQRDAHDDQGIRRRSEQAQEEFRSARLQAIYDREWSAAGYIRRLPRRGIPQGRP